MFGNVGDSHWLYHRRLVCDREQGSICPLQDAWWSMNSLNNYGTQIVSILPEKHLEKCCVEYGI